MSYQDNHYFYDIAKDKKMLLYGIVEADLTPSTLLTAGISYTRAGQCALVSRPAALSDRCRPAAAALDCTRLSLEIAGTSTRPRFSVASSRRLGMTGR